MRYLLTQLSYYLPIPSDCRQAFVDTVAQRLDKLWKEIVKDRNRKAIDHRTDVLKFWPRCIERIEGVLPQIVFPKAAAEAVAQAIVVSDVHVQYVWTRQTDIQISRWKSL